MDIIELCRKSNAQQIAAELENQEKLMKESIRNINKYLEKQDVDRAAKALAQYNKHKAFADLIRKVVKQNG